MLAAAVLFCLPGAAAWAPTAPRLPAPPTAPFSIEDFGAVAGLDSREQAVANGKAFADAIAAAAAATAAEQRGVLVPADFTYSFLPAVASFSGLSNVTVFLEGTLALYTTGFWDPVNPYPGFGDTPWPPLEFDDCSGVSIISATGNGLLDGRGNEWWWYTILLHDSRPHALVQTTGCRDFKLQGFRMLNAPKFHVSYNAGGIDGSCRSSFDQLTVQVDIKDQVEIYRYIGAAEPGADLAAVLAAAGKIGGPLGQVQQPGELGREPTAQTHARRRSALPGRYRAQGWFDAQWPLANVTPPVPMMWALNTDGIDVNGVDISVTSCAVTNFDDAVCVKPTDSCSSRIHIDGIQVTYGVGVSMGSVTPGSGGSVGSCIDGVLASNIHFEVPLKGIYIKPNPAKEEGARGLIANVAYENVTMRHPLWWPVYIGTQQQHQPDNKVGTGCPFVYPFHGTTCLTDPQVTLANVTLRNVRVDLGPESWGPGIVVANASNPGTGFIWDNVVFNPFRLPAPPTAASPPGHPVPYVDIITEQIYGEVLGPSEPVPAFL